MRKLIYLVAGARPNFMKIAPIIRALQAEDSFFQYQIIHTGQHYDHWMSGIFFEELGIPQPDFYLNCGGGTHAEQTAKIMIAFEGICSQQKPDCVLVVGDVNSTLACSIVAKKLHIPVAHVEAGLRSGDLEMPEEINRLVTDSISDWFFCTEPQGITNLISEGKKPENIFNVGHVMIDNLTYQLKKIDSYNSYYNSLKSDFKQYAILTLHRPSNVDNKQSLENIFKAVNQISYQIPIIFPVHPRTKASLDNFGIDINPTVKLLEPLSYMDFLYLWKDASFVMTDSGGLQEETTALNIPCITLRNNTERPITVELGSNTLVGNDSNLIIETASTILSGKAKMGKTPELWDGKSAQRIVSSLKNLL